MSDPKDYEGREQTLVKHIILEKYLARFAHIVGTWASSITYVDCFSGPWKAQSEEHKDTSFALAIGELRKAQETLKQRNPQLTLRCYFLERRLAAYRELERFAGNIRGVEVQTRKMELAQAIPDILAFVEKGGRTFPFIFIDPTGWTGFGMEVIRPLCSSTRAKCWSIS